jgi:hypothetical protein
VLSLIEVADTSINNLLPAMQRANEPTAEEDSIFASATATQAIRVLEALIDLQDTKIAALESEITSRPTPDQLKDQIQEVVSALVDERLEELEVRLSALEAGL